MGNGRTIEETFNQALGRALRKACARWSAKPECIKVEETQLLHTDKGSGLRPDILIDDGVFPPVVIECSFGALDADRDAVARLGLETRRHRARIGTAIALHIPQRFRKAHGFNIADMLLEGAPLAYAVHQLLESKGQTSIAGTHERRWPQDGFITGDVYDLVTLLSAAGLPREEVRSVGDSVALLVEAAANGLEAALPVGGQQQIAGHLHQRSPLKGLRTTVVLWLNALLTQQRLAAQGVVGAPFIDFTGSSAPNVLAQIEVWRTINRHNWNSVFEPAIKVFELASKFDPGGTSRMLRKLIEAVIEIETARLGLHINIGAELFPKLSEDRKTAAAFYTQSATAELLAGLTIEPSMLTAEEWADPDLFRKRCLSDLACGTGTLLRAGYHRVATLHEQAGGSTESLRDLHAAAMEGGLIGADVSPIAAHLTTSSLAALGYGDPYGDTQIGWVNVGGEKGQTGSLEYFAAQQVVDLFNVGAGRSIGNGNGAENSVSVPDISMDWILMNPPYSRTRGGQSVFDIAGLSRAERQACQRRWKHLVRDAPVNNQAGLAASFLVLAHQKCKPGGRIGFVLPLSAAFAESWAVTRQMITREFTDIVAITVASGQALGRRALSADTGMEEMLFVGTKRTTNHHADTPPSAAVHCVTLRAPVLRAGEAGEVARSIHSVLGKAQDSEGSYAVRVGDDEIGQMCTFTTSGHGAPWNPLGVLHADLAAAANTLLDGVLQFNGHVIPLGVPMCSLGELFEVGPTHHLIGHLSGRNPIGAFEFVPVFNSVDAIGSDRALWRADSSTQKQLLVPLTHKGMSPAGAKSKAKQDAMRAARSTLFYARNMRWTSQALLAAVTTYPGMGGRAWTSLQHDDPHVLKAFALWANSTLGFLVHWTQGQRTQSGRSTTQVKALTGIPCPRLDQIPATQLERAATVFDRLSTEPLLPACQAHADDVRKQIDYAVLEMLNLPDGTAPAIMDTLRWLWCNEPSVHGQNKNALRRLKQT